MARSRSSDSSLQAAFSEMTAGRCRQRFPINSMAICHWWPEIGAHLSKPRARAGTGRLRGRSPGVACPQRRRRRPPRGARGVMKGTLEATEQSLDAAREDASDTSEMADGPQASWPTRATTARPSFSRSHVGELFLHRPGLPDAQRGAGLEEVLSAGPSPATPALQTLTAEPLDGRRPRTAGEPVTPVTIASDPLPGSRPPWAGFRGRTCAG
jgi:hypothetical protein